MYNERRSVRPSLNFTFLPLGVASILSPLLANEAFSLVINVPIFSFPLLFVSTLSSRSRSYSVCLSFSVGIYKISYTTRRIHGMRKYTSILVYRAAAKKRFTRRVSPRSVINACRKLAALLHAFLSEV